MGSDGNRDVVQDDASSPEWIALLEHLHAARGFDFSGYKRTSLMRRVRRRMADLGIEDFGAYRDHLEVHPDEFHPLFDTILINVTGFFRDGPAWEAVATRVIPEILAARPDHEPIRAWSAGCASGAEPYSIAILLAEALGPEAFRSRVKIYATDMDDAALAQARTAVYRTRELEGVPPAVRERYFQASGDDWVFHKDFRRQVIFGRHNLLEDAPISHVDLLVCRNVLMYFNADAQAQILARFHFALNPGGFLFLGRAETLMAHSHAFEAVDLKRRISRKTPRVPLYRDRATQSYVPDPSPDPDVRLRDLALDGSPAATILIDADGRLVLANERAQQTFGITPGDLNAPLQNLRVSYRPVELRSLIDQAAVERRPVMAKSAEWRTAAGEVLCFDVQVCPLFDGGSEPLGVAVTFTDVTIFRRLEGELQQTNQELETAYEELQSTNEELETTNEELQSTIEELETTNEEVQSTNEELETMNEELQSTNEELQTLNEELHRRSDELNDANAFLESVLGSLRSAVVVVNRDLRVLRWNSEAQELWGLRAAEVGDRHLLNLDIGLPVDRLRAPLRSCLADGAPQSLTLDAVNRRGRRIACEVHCVPLARGLAGDTSRVEPADDGSPAGAVLIIDARPASEPSAREAAR